MKRREFIKTAGLAAVAGVTGSGARAARLDGVQQLLQLRTFLFATEEKLKLFADFIARSLIPALNRAGVTPVGAFRLLKADNPKAAGDELVIRMLLPFPEAGRMLTLPHRIAADEAFVAAQQAVLSTPMKDPVYQRFDTQLMLAFDQCPKVETPTHAADRVFQLRIYESHNCERAARKVAMFNEGGEIALFRRLGMNPVFFGASLAGTRLPNLHYMLGFANTATMEAGWKKFLEDPEWLKLKGNPQYKDTVS
ncbi:MAG: NIPSNAP family protein, partial [Kiritimatiellaeota bacterium]|nr:NIPSNAP family protein [Kiritimatiellota bacterium]